MPNGDPLMTPDVRRVKHIRYLMIDHAAMGDAEKEDIIVNASSGASADENTANVDMATPDSGSEPDNVVSASLFEDNLAPETGPLLSHGKDRGETTPHLPKTATPQQTQVLIQQNTTLPPFKNTAVPQAKISPLPLVRHRSSSEKEAGGPGDNEIMSLVKVMMVQDQQRRDEDARRREYEA